MNLFKKIYCRVYQTVLKLAIPILPYREPKLLKDYDELVFEMKKANLNAPLLVTDKQIKSLGLTKKLEETIKNNKLNLHIFDGTQPNPTTDDVECALKVYLDNKCDSLIGFGGGSAMDIAKAVGVRIAKPKKHLSELKGILKVRRKLPTLFAIPTTAGTGSETTIASVITDSKTRHKYAINDFPLIPKFALLDANLTLKLPQKITSTTGMDALTHAVEAYIGNSTTRQTRQYSKQAVKLIFENLLTCYNHPDNFEARHNMLVASYKAGLAFTKSYVGYVHAVAHSLGGKYNTAHGLANAVILPIMLKKYGKKIYKKLYELGVYAGLFNKETSIEKGAKSFIQNVEELNKQMNIPSTLADIQLDDIPSLAKTAEKEANPLYPVPVLYTAKQLEEVYLDVKNG